MEVSFRILQKVVVRSQSSTIYFCSLDSRGVAKLGDFGVSHLFENEQNIGAMRRFSEAPQHHPTQLTRMDTDSTLQMTGLAGVGLLQKTEGTWCFWSPEMCNSSSYFSGYAADMWAAGVCLYIFVAGKLPFFSEVPTELFEMIAQADVPYQGLGLSNSLIDLLEMILEKDPAKRAGVGDCLKHPFLQVARSTRIMQLSEEFAQSRSLNTAVEEEDLRKVRYIVTILSSWSHASVSAHIFSFSFVDRLSASLLLSSTQQCCSETHQNTYKRDFRVQEIVCRREDRHFRPRRRWQDQMMRNRRDGATPNYGICRRTIEARCHH